MNCASCIAYIEHVFHNQKGIVHVAVNFATANAHIEYIPKVVYPNKLRKAVQAIGYNFLIENNTETISFVNELHNKK